MEFKGHLFTYLIVWGIFLGSDYFTLVTIDWFFYVSALFAFFIINSDIDPLIWGAKAHRWFFTHSVLFSLLLHQRFSPYMSADLTLAKEFAILLFLPILVHLVADFQVNQLFGNAKRTWTISFFPLKLQFGKWSSFLWMFLNVAGIMWYATTLCGIELFLFFLN